MRQFYIIIGGNSIYIHMAILDQYRWHFLCTTYDNYSFTTHMSFLICITQNMPFFQKDWIPYFPVVFWFMACQLLPYLYVHTTVWAWESSSWSIFSTYPLKILPPRPSASSYLFDQILYEKGIFVMSQLSSRVYVSITLSSRKEPLVQGNFPSFPCDNSFIIDLVLSVPLTWQFQWFKH